MLASDKIIYRDLKSNPPKQFQLRHLGKDKPPVFQEDIGETTSLIYSPFYVHKGRLFDSILNKVIQSIEPVDIDMKPSNLCRPEKETVFISGICPDCGWDLEGHFKRLEAKDGAARCTYDSLLTNVNRSLKKYNTANIQYHQFVNSVLAENPKMVKRFKKRYKTMKKELGWI